jgi:hypothetical protein
LVFNRLFVVLVVPVVHPFVKVFWRPWLFRVLVIEFLKLMQALYKVLHRVPDQVRVIALPVYTVF